MRRALLKSWPALTRFYGGAITPQSVEWFTFDELNEYIAQMNQAMRAKK